VLLVEYDFANRNGGLLGSEMLAIAAADVEDLSVETSHIVAERIMKLGGLLPDQTMITSSCGLNHREWRIAFGKLRARAEAKQVVD
jgi:5-methyltetrahydropteroyltriglutamate--homocysteine methyltransferase